MIAKRWPTGLPNAMLSSANAELAGDRVGRPLRLYLVHAGVGDGVVLEQNVEAVGVVGEFAGTRQHDRGP